MSNSVEEEIARNYICFGNHDCTVVVVDATCLERNLNLVYQILEITNNVVVCVNLLDEAQKKGIRIDFEILSSSLGVPVVGVTARKKKTLKKLMEAVYKVSSGSVACFPHIIHYVPAIESAISLLEENLKDETPLPNRWVALKFLEGNDLILSELSKKYEIDFNNYLFARKQAMDNLAQNSIDQTNLADVLISNIMFEAEEICRKAVHFDNINYSIKDRKIDKIITSKKYGYPIMLLLLGIVFWITIVGSNYPSSWLGNIFDFIEYKLLNLFNIIHVPAWITQLLIAGVYRTTAWVVSVMLPPMAIFFPLFTFLEDSGFLPRIAFNLDNFFKKAGTSGKQALTMCMGFGCNAAGIIGCRIISSPRERLIAIITNAFVPCNGRFPFLITVATVFFASSLGFSSFVATLAVLFVVTLGVIFTLLISKLLSKTILKGMPSSFVLELPPYRRPQLGKVIVRSIFDRTLFVLR